MADEIIASLVIDSTPKQLPVSPTQESQSSVLSDDDSLMQEVSAVLGMGSSGIIFRGCPGTGKTWYAWQVALKLTDNDPSRIVRVQFHSSMGYEDFVEGYKPTQNSKSGFEVVPKTFLQTVELANGTDKPVVFIIDEINRGDPSRVFGELLTYIEDGWRGVQFTTPFRGEPVSIPRNLILLATMNQHDRSITQLDMAMLRRFDHIDIYPSSDLTNQFLIDAGMVATDASKITEWFEQMQQLLPFGMGHTYFLNVGDNGRLAQVWRYRILPFCESVLEFEPDKLGHVSQSFKALERRLSGQQESDD
ncbi:McrB family protein [Stieleria marina]|uniref:McrB family protein n=1 Tax=Stieleria marina TaxID=1930275 RepID=UPI003AF3B143